MGKHQNPFSLYDFLGYFIPGAIILYLTIFACFHSKPGAFNYQAVEKTVELLKSDIYVPFIIASYVLGHLFSFLSSITVEKYSIWKCGYPSKYLIGVEGFGYFHTSDSNRRRVFGRIFVAIILAPISILDYIIGNWLNLRQLYVKSANDMTASYIKKGVTRLYEQTFGGPLIEPDTWFKENSFFRMCYHYALENSKSHGTKMQNYVALFGFTRTLTLIFVCFFWVFVWHMIAGRLGLGTSLTLLFGTSFTSYFFYIAFNKFYRRFSLESLMAMGVIVNSDQCPPKARLDHDSHQ